MQLSQVFIQQSDLQFQQILQFKSIFQRKMVKMIDNYTLLDVIGQGNYGKVYKAKNLKTNKQYAIKIIPSDKLHQNSKLQQCTMNQVQTLTTIGLTEHIIMYYQMLKTKNNYYFVYEYCNGGTLMELINREEHLDENRAIGIFKQLLEAFKVLNRLNIMHRDLKPENIFFTDNKVKLGDFGFCKGLKPEENMTKTMLGSPIYMAPQVLRGQSYSTKADIWSLGVILYEMLYGKCPFQSNSIAMLINTINCTQIILPTQIKVSQKTQKLIIKLLTKDYFKRIGWIELFNYFQDQIQKENVFKSSPTNRFSLDKKSSLVEEWASKKKISQSNIKERSISQDIQKKDKSKYQLGSLENISPSNLQNRSTPVAYNQNENRNFIQNNTRNINQNDNRNINQNDNRNINGPLSVKDIFASDHKSFSSIRQGDSSPFQGYKKPGSLPKRDMITEELGKQSVTSSYKPQSTKKIFYSQNYQNIFSSPILQKQKQNQNQSIELTQQGHSQSISTFTTEIDKSNQRSSFAKNSPINRNHMIKRKDNSNKRKHLLTIHQECVNMLKIVYQQLQTQRQSYLKVAYLVLITLMDRLKDITKQIAIVQVNLLDIASLVNYQIIQVDRTIVDIRQQIQTNYEIIPSAQTIIDTFQFNESNAEQIIIKQFIQKHMTFNLQQQNIIEKNISIIGMLQKNKQQEMRSQSAPLNKNDDAFGSQTNTSKQFISYNKLQYHTTNGFAQYYRNLVESKDKTYNPKITIV